MRMRRAGKGRGGSRVENFKKMGEIKKMIKG